LIQFFAGVFVEAAFAVGGLLVSGAAEGVVGGFGGDLALLVGGQVGAAQMVWVDELVRHKFRPKFGFARYVFFACFEIA
jgi:hypothetical protein